VPNPSQFDADSDLLGDHCDHGDSDGDGYPDEDEARHIGTRADYPCGIEWPSNMFDSGLSLNKLDIQDVISFVAPVRRLDTDDQSTRYDARWDVSPGPTSPFASWINIIDITTLLNGTTGSPPMFGGARAFSKACPMPPPA